MKDRICDAIVAFRPDVCVAHSAGVSRLIRAMIGHTAEAPREVLRPGQQVEAWSSQLPDGLPEPLGGLWRRGVVQRVWDDGLLDVRYEGAGCLSELRKDPATVRAWPAASARRVPGVWSGPVDGRALVCLCSVSLLRTHERGLPQRPVGTALERP